MSKQNENLFEFGPFLLDAEEQSLTKDGEAISLPPKALATLLLLVTNAGRVVTKTEIMESVWPEIFVQEQNLVWTIHLLRKALGDEASSPKYIETRPRRGYRFIAMVRTLRSEVPSLAPEEAELHTASTMAVDRSKASPASENVPATTKASEFIGSPVSGQLRLMQSRLDGRYDILECLARGSYAEVYLAHDKAASADSPSTVVIKALNMFLQETPDEELERTLIRNFQNEAVALDLVRHPNVINRLGHGTAMDLRGTTFHYLVLEYMPGGDMSALTRRNPLPITSLLFYMQQVCSALGNAHRQGVIHRDIKPQNLLLSADHKVVKITDFGVARLLSSEGELTRVGTNIYSPLEHNPLINTPSAAKLTPAADIYSLAKTTYVLLTGESPRRFAQHQITELPELVASEPWAVGVLRALQRATEDTPEDRYQSVDEFYSDLSVAISPYVIKTDKHSDITYSEQSSDRATPPVFLFYFYSQKDEAARLAFESQLELLKTQNVISGWQSRSVRANDQLEQTIDLNLDYADIVLPLVSPDLIASDYYDKQLTRALERHYSGEASLIPIVLRNADWRATRLANLHSIPKNATPILSWQNQQAAWKQVSGEIKQVAVETRKRKAQTADEDRRSEAELAEQMARTSLAQLRYKEARTQISLSMAYDPKRSSRLREEFGFLLTVPTTSDGNLLMTPDEEERLRWESRLWCILSARNTFEPTSSDGDRGSITDALDQVAHDHSALKERESRDSSSRQKGELLECAVLRLFQEFFRLEENEEALLHRLKKLRQQKPGTQFGFDIGLEFDCVLQSHRTIRCHVECKNLSDKIALKDIADKLIAQNHFDAEIDLWVLISPYADPSNELEQILERWKQDSPYPFDVRIWCPSTGVAEFFGLEPAVYDLLYEHPTKLTHPKDWEENKRNAVRKKWRDELTPPVRLPNGWKNYLRQPHLLCLRREEPDVFEATFTSHVTMLCKNESGVLLTQPLEYCIREWLIEVEKPVIFVLGEFGDGKTFFTYTLARHLASEFLQNPKTGWLPVRFSLRDLPEARTSREFLRLRLEEFGADLEGWTSLRAKYQLLIVLDGFDEISKQLDPKTITKNISLLLNCLEEFDGCKVLITSRTHFFESRRDVQRLMSRLGEPRIYHLAPIPRQTTVDHLEEVAKQLNLQESMTKLHDLHDPIGLASKPLFLQMLKDTLHDLPNDVNEVTLYDKYIRHSLERKAEQLDDKELLTDRRELLRNLELLLEEIAVELQTSKREYVSLSKFAQTKKKGFAEFLWKMTGSDEDQADAKARVGIRSLLSRVDTREIDEEWAVDFCHRSIREYFVARGLCSAVAQGMEEGERFLKTVPVNHEILDFAALHMRNTDLEQSQDTLMRLIRRAIPERGPGRLGGSALTLLYRISPNLPASDWSGKVFDYADLEGANLSGRSFRESSFRFANLTNVNFEDSDFEYCDFTGVRIEETAGVVALAAAPLGDRLLAVYEDGTVREWNLIHPRKSESRLIASHSPKQYTLMGMSSPRLVWMCSQDEITFFNFDPLLDMKKRAIVPINPSYKLVSPSATDLVIVQDVDEETKTSGLTQTNLRIMLVALDQSATFRILAMNSVSHCIALSREALLLNDQVEGLRVLRLGKEETPLRFPGIKPTCLSSFCLRPLVHLIACGQQDGSAQVWFVDLRQPTITVRNILAHQIHDGPVTAITFLDDLRVASGGVDRAIVITRINPEADTVNDKLERRLHFTLRCKGMQIKGLKGSDERNRLQQLITKAEVQNQEESHFHESSEHA